jgi:hypothetical protein
VRKLEPKEVFSYGKYKKRCNYPNSLIANKKALQNARLFLSAPLTYQNCSILKMTLKN